MRQSTISLFMTANICGLNHQAEMVSTVKSSQLGFTIAAAALDATRKRGLNRQDIKRKIFFLTFVLCSLIYEFINSLPNCKGI